MLSGYSQELGILAPNLTAQIRLFFEMTFFCDFSKKVKLIFFFKILKFCNTSWGLSENFQGLRTLTPITTAEVAVVFEI